MNDRPTDEPEQQSEEQPTDSDQPAEQPEGQPTAADQAVEQSEDQPADTDQAAEQSDEQAVDSGQPAEQSEEQPVESDQPTEQSEEQAAAEDQTTEPSEEQAADSDQAATSASADNTVAFAAGAASTGGAGPGVQARPGPQPKRAPRAPVPQAPARHDFAVRFTFGTSMLVKSSPFLAKGFYRFEIRADDGTTLATRDWSPVSVTVPPLINFSLTQITRSGEKSPSFDFHVDLSWLPFSTTSTGSPADPNDPNNANMIEKDFRIITTLRPKDNDSTFLTIPPPKGTVVTKIDLHSDIGIVDDVVSAPSTNENDFIAALFNRGVDLDKLVEKGPPQQTKDGKFLYEVKYYGGARIKGATVLP